ncbi:protein TonB [Pantoea alhagi]|uniref:TonB system transport protein TonB n=1 Tax=Mixta sp. BE291 TaxID=3158787 RepID=UPI0028632782|nr:protein TonB [Pantoea alhagi]
MTTLTTPLPRRLSVSMLLSVALHGSVIAALLYASFNRSVEAPKMSQPISVSLVAPEVQPQAQPTPQPAPEPEPQPEPEPEPQPAPEPPKPEPVPIPKPEPKPKPKPKPKPVKKEVVKPRKEVKPQTEPRPASPFQENSAKTTAAKPSTAPKTSPAPSNTVSDGPRALSVGKPGYPARAFALRIEGRVRVQYDVDSSGRVDNIRILSAQPRNMFERDVKQAMRKWRYESGKPGSNLTMTIVFRINGGTSLE